MFFGVPQGSIRILFYFALLSASLRMAEKRPRRVSEIHVCILLYLITVQLLESAICLVILKHVSLKYNGPKQRENSLQNIIYR
jgi:hypothetical protein